MEDIKNIRERLKNNKSFEKSLIPEIPNNMLIELSNVCNYECIFCANSKMTREKGEIDKQFLFRILKEAYDLGVTDVGFYATGEPFVCENLNVYIRKAKEIGYKYIYLTTNGALANPEKLKQVFEAGLDSIKFSINAGTKETYKMIHGRDKFENVINNLKFASEYRKKHKKSIKLYVSYIVTRQNENEKEILEQLIGDIVDDIIFLEVRNQGGVMYEINEHLILEEKKYDTNKPPCPLPFNSLHITYEGYLTACCIDFQNYLVVADLNKSSLNDSWGNEEFMRLRGKQLNNRLEGSLCYNCMYNKNIEIEPLIPKYATYFHYDNYTKEDEITKSISNIHIN